MELHIYPLAVAPAIGLRLSIEAATGNKSWLQDLGLPAGRAAAIAIISSPWTEEMKRIAIIQSAYIPWRGFFDLIARCDEYVIYDSVQFSKGHWHNRNLVKVANGRSWLTIPVKTSSKLTQPIDQVEVSGAWASMHWDKLKAAYKGAAAASSMLPFLEGLYAEAALHTSLSAINELFLRAICKRLQIGTEIVRDEIYQPVGSRTDRVLDVCVKAGASHYLSGPAAKAYLEEDKFQAHGISVEWMVYPDYPAYDQLWGEFDGGLSIVDMLLNAGASRPELWKPGAR